MKDTVILSLFCRFLVDQVPFSKTSGTSSTSTTGSRPQTLPLHLALRQSANKNHRTFMDERNRPPSQNGSSTPPVIDIPPPNPPKSILKKTSNAVSVADKDRKPGSSKNRVQINIDVH